MVGKLGNIFEVYKAIRIMDSKSLLEKKENLSTQRMILLILLIMFMVYDIYLISTNGLEQTKVLFWIPTVLLSLIIAIITVKIRKIDTDLAK